MRITIFGRGANPRVDAPLCHKSKHYVATEVAANRMEWISERAAKVRGKQTDQTDYMAAMEDWRVVRQSKLPNGERLRISTLQLVYA
jgi:hypothetical protein